MTHRRPIARTASSCWDRRPEARTGSLRMPVRTSGRGRGASSERRRAERGESRERDLRRADPRLHPPPPPRGAAGARAQCRRLLADLRCAGRLAAELHAADGHRAGGGARAGLEPGGGSWSPRPSSRSCSATPKPGAPALDLVAGPGAARAHLRGRRRHVPRPAARQRALGLGPEPLAGEASPRPVSAPSQRRSARSCASTTRLASRPPSIRSGDSQSGASRPRLESIPGIARVTVHGGAATRVEVRPDAAAMLGHGVTLPALEQAIGAGQSFEPARLRERRARSASRSAPRASSRSTISTPSATR